MAHRVDIGDHKASSVKAGSPSAKTPIWKIALPALIIVGATVWIVILLVGGGSGEVIVPPEKQTAAKILHAIGDREDLLEHLSVRTDGADAQLVVKVSGTVKTKALLDELTQKVKDAAGSTPVEMDVKVKP